MSANSDTLSYLRDLVYKRSAIVIEPSKDYLFEARLGGIARDEGLTSLDGLVMRLREKVDSPTHTRVVEAMTTNETSFFRDIHPFETLKSTVIPAMIRARATSRALNIWCGAASTGQEPYTIAMVLRESFPELASWSVQITATDLNETVLARAREGVYKQLEVNRGLPAPMLVKYFERAGADWRIKSDLRKLVEYRQLNLLGNWPLRTRPDIVFLRNVLIYFDVETKRTILRRVREQLRPDGALFLGGAETTVNIDDAFEPVRAGSSVYYRPVTKTAKKGEPHAA